ncbi:DeoR/GlpR family transcriptional regulator of sugar metabolism [Breznakia sp. PF5-3]|uniref:DeoR/GlpR family DNA-binding transcription regulator n=1 Tax=unclassified Breznakia TaxID=2623764 RepID=UPI0024062505|nr:MULTISPECIES: DeoR/GlpR family DNA-binding transcription regulator [unclassified Breznakia]MDF9823826.1 DeoR/GlpR family transcriptional regulator of sugar metabolism [Breznakia sp. PM6-1]MDF9834608.1 DeoR/GlpR family transcriptional regulator of sugar metabolism [Breznakia sp. PF5-3]MDF9836775.1 DeoR/GlpR family transcriptional regulator of sugar metabolism [Breznakia sp. PFB2-8]MDF9858776.1 DeoR/GlpR family transcriptional regulator of sugar metabolism [Breznakia sp. PH5-24]
MSQKTRKRRDEITKIVISEGQVKVKELAKQLNVSTETIRKDLHYLDMMGVISKSHGGASVINEYFQLPIDVKLQENLDAKKKIARAALDLIEDNSLIYLDPGSTCIQIAKLLRVKRNLTVLTNSITIANIVADSSHNVIVCGGMLQKRGKALVGIYAIDVIKTIHIDTAIMGSDGFKDMNGFTTFSLEEAEIRKTIVSSSDVNIVVCDASKFNKTSTYIFGKFSDYDYLVTDEDDAKKLKQVSGIKKIISVRSE